MEKRKGEVREGRGEGTKERRENEEINRRDWITKEWREEKGREVENGEKRRERSERGQKCRGETDGKEQT